MRLKAFPTTGLQVHKEMLEVIATVRSRRQAGLVNQPSIEATQPEPGKPEQRKFQTLQYLEGPSAGPSSNLETVRSVKWPSLR